jgi:hypothetical protein
MKLGTRIRLARRAAVVMVVAGLTATLGAAPALAEQATYADPADATGSLTDIRRVVVDHRASALVVKVGFTDLRRHSTAGPAGLTIALDTRADRPGAEYRLTTGLQTGTDFQLTRVRNGRPFGEGLTCRHRMRLDFPADRLVFAAARSCLGSPEKIRIAVRMRDDFDPSHPVVDWLGEPRSWTDRLTSA